MSAETTYPASLMNVSRSQSNQATSHRISTSGVASIAGAAGVAVDSGLVLVLAPSGADADGGFAAADASCGGCKEVLNLVVTCGLPIWP